MRVLLYDRSGKIVRDKNKLTEDEARNLASQWAYQMESRAKIFDGKRQIEEYTKSKVQERMNEAVAQAVAIQRMLFEEKFGRKPTPEDPIFFDPEKDTPTPISKDQIAKIVETMAAHGLRKK